MPIFRARMKMRLDDNVAMQPSIVFEGVAFPPTATDADIVAELAIIMTTIYGAWINSWATTTLYESVEVFEIDPVGGSETSIGEDSIAGGGITPGTPAPNVNACGVYASVSGGGRKARKSTSGFLVGALVGNNWGGGLLADAALFGGEWVQTRIGSITGANYGPGIWSTKDQVYKPLSGVFEVASLIGSADTRKPGVGI